MVEIIKQFFGNNISNLERFVGAVGISGFISLVFSIFFIVYKGKKFDKAIEQIEKEADEKIKEYKEQNEEAFKQLKEDTEKTLDNLCNMFLLEATKEGVDIDKFNAIVDIYKKTIKTEMLDTDELEAIKKQEIENTQTQQESVNENLNNIDKVLNDYI